MKLHKRTHELDKIYWQHGLITRHQGFLHSVSMLKKPVYRYSNQAKFDIIIMKKVLINRYEKLVAYRLKLARQLSQIFLRICADVFVFMIFFLGNTFLFVFVHLKFDPLEQKYQVTKSLHWNTYKFGSKVNTPPPFL